MKEGLPSGPSVLTIGAFGSLLTAEAVHFASYLPDVG